MNRLLKSLVAVFLATTVSLIAGQSASADGLTVFPASLEFSDTFRGGQYFSSVVVINNSDVEAVFRFEAEGDAAQWLSFVEVADRTKPLDDLTLAPGAQAEVFARLAIPANTANGRYSGAVSVLRSVDAAAVRSGGTSGNADLTIGTRLALAVSVSGTQRVEGSFMELAVADTEVGLPVKSQSTIQNTGNVFVAPKVNVEIVSGSSVVAGGEFADDTVYPNEVKHIVSEVDTSKLTPGDYAVRVQVGYGDQDLGRLEKPFTLHPRGTLTRRGVLDSLQLTNAPTAGTAAKVVARFRNTGQIDSKALFVGELSRNGELIKGITGIERSVARGEASVLEVFVDIPENGRYKLLGKVSFEGNETETRELAFEVGTGSPLLRPGGAVLAVLVAGALAAVAWRWRSRRMPGTGIRVASREPR